MKIKFLVLVCFFMFSYCDLALADPANDDLEDIVTQSGKLGSLIGEFILMVIGIGGMVYAGTGFKRILSKHNDEQTQQGGPLRIAIGMILMSFPIIVAVSTGYFTSEEADVTEIVKNPFSN